MGYMRRLVYICAEEGNEKQFISWRWVRVVEAEDGNWRVLMAFAG